VYSTPSKNRVIAVVDAHAMDEDIPPRASVPRAQGEIEQYRKFWEEGLDRLGDYL
jgi:hypothetical protein